MKLLVNDNRDVYNNIVWDTDKENFTQLIYRLEGQTQENITKKELEEEMGITFKQIEEELVITQLDKETKKLVKKLLAPKMLEHLTQMEYENNIELTKEKAREKIINDIMTITFIELLELSGEE